MKLVVSTDTESISLDAEHVLSVHADEGTVSITALGRTYTLAVKDTARAIRAISEGIVKATTGNVSVHVRPDEGVASLPWVEGGPPDDGKWYLCRWQAQDGATPAVMRCPPGSTNSADLTHHIPTPIPELP